MFLSVITFNPCNIYTLTYKLTLNSPFKASSFPSLFEGNASPTSPLTASPSLTPCRFCQKTSCVVCLFVITLTLVTPSIFTLMLIVSLLLGIPPFSVSTREWCSTHYALGRTLFLVAYNDCYNSILYCARAPILHILFFSLSFNNLRE
jgi:hypothetical protein